MFGGCGLIGAGSKVGCGLGWHSTCISSLVPYTHFNRRSFFAIVRTSCSMLGPASSTIPGHPCKPFPASLISRHDSGCNRGERVHQNRRTRSPKLPRAEISALYSSRACRVSVSQASLCEASVSLVAGRGGGFGWVSVIVNG